MNREILIIRHAKSSWDDPALEDRDRPLAVRGERAAPLMGQLIAHRDWLPELIVSSVAKRAQQTARLLADAMGCAAGQVVTDGRLYVAGLAEWQEVIRDQPDDYRRIALVGHNPAIEQTAQWLFPLQVRKVPTAAVIYGRFRVDSWLKADALNAELVDFATPKHIGA